MNPSLLRLISIGKFGGRALGRFSAITTILGTPTYYMGKAFHKYWLKDEDARKKPRDYVCSPYSSQSTSNKIKKK